MLIGIDFGTYDSGIAVFTHNMPQVIKSGAKDMIISSRVALGKQPIIGNDIPKYTFTKRHVIKSIKRHLGEQNYRIMIDDKFYTPVEIAALSLKDLKETAEFELGESITETVITVPVMFNDVQRKALKQAATIAGFEKVNLINEATAIALAYAEQKKFQANELNIFYSIGAGMYDVSLVEINNDVIEVVASSGSNCLGSDDFDDRIVEWLVQDFYSKHAIDLSNDSNVIKRLTVAAENAKIELSEKEETNIKVVAVTNNGNQSLDIDTCLSRSHFNTLVASLINELKQPIERLCKDASYLISEVDNILLAGGGSQVPLIKETLIT